MGISVLARVAVGVCVLLACSITLVCVAGLAVAALLLALAWRAINPVAAHDRTSTPSKIHLMGSLPRVLGLGLLMGSTPGSAMMHFMLCRRDQRLDK
jgi:hypothetical protein